MQLSNRKLLKITDYLYGIQQSCQSLW